MATNSNYDATSITSLKFPENVRVRPDMYIGDRGIDGYHHCAFEIIDNSVDEHLAGFANHIIITLQKDSTLEVEDNGRGIPTDMHPTEKVSAMELVMTKLHAGGKFDRSSYQISGGLHGVGLSVVNALSSFMDVESYRDNTISKISFEKGKKVKDIHVTGKTTKQGTKVSFKPDNEIFQIDHFSSSILLSRLKEIAFLNAGLKIDFINYKETDIDTGKPTVYNIYFEHGITDFLQNEILKDAKESTLLPHFIYFKDQNKKSGTTLECAFQYKNKGGDPQIFSYVNSIHTRGDGLHVDAFVNAYVKVLQKIAVRLNIDKKGDKINKKSLLIGMSCIINTLIPNAEFKGQTKDKLTEPTDAKRVLQNLAEGFFTVYFEKNLNQAEMILKKAVLELKALSEAEKAMENTRSKIAKGKKSTMVAVAGKLADCTSRIRAKKELFIVEGDSAGGSAKQGRNREFQAILPLRGKVLNVEKKLSTHSINPILSNNEIKTMIAVLGMGYYTNVDVSKLNYNKVIIMTDADVDGAHIQILLLTFFYRFLNPLITEGHLYIAQPPLYKITSGKKHSYVFDEKEKSKLLATIYKGKKVDVQRYKGLGEMNGEQLWETTMNPENRKLLQVSINDLASAEHYLQLLMTDNMDSNDKKNFILNNTELVTNIDDIG